MCERRAARLGQAAQRPAVRYDELLRESRDFNALLEALEVQAGVEAVRGLARIAQAGQ